jgi:hypothetical protein
MHESEKSSVNWNKVFLQVINLDNKTMHNL